MEEERTYGYFMHNVARAHAANYSVNVFKWGVWRLKLLYPHTLDELKYICETVTSIKGIKLKLASNNHFMRPGV
jgi:hypothetical protein